MRLSLFMAYGLEKLSHEPNKVTDMVVLGTRLGLLASTCAKRQTAYTRKVINVVVADILPCGSNQWCCDSFRFREAVRVLLPAARN